MTEKVEAVALMTKLFAIVKGICAPYCAIKPCSVVFTKAPKAAKVWLNGIGMMTGKTKFDPLEYTDNFETLLMDTFPSKTFDSDCRVLPSALNSDTFPFIHEYDVVLVASVIVIVAPFPTNIGWLELSHAHVVTFHVQDWSLPTANATFVDVAVALDAPAMAAIIITPKNAVMASLVDVFNGYEPPS